MATTTELKAGDVVEITVIIKSMTSFWRHNRWSHRDELSYCISMAEVDADDDDPWFKTFTSSKFVDAVAEGETVTVQGKFKKVDLYNGQVQHVITHCKKL